ncbi:MAG: M48 family metallopeptidase, partial [Spirochaetia bacterium]
VEGAVRPPRPALTSGEVHFVQGRGYVLDVVESGGRHRVGVTGDARLELRVRPGTDMAGRWRALDRFYRELLERRVPELLARWQPRMRVAAAEWRIKSMKTRWGTCNVRARRIWLNVDLARRPERCLEYVVVHELVHLLERNHSKRFYALMDEFLPDWRARREELNAAWPVDTPPPGSSRLDC